MPIVSKRGNRLKQSPIRSLIPYARQAKVKGNHVYHLNIGQPDILTPKAALDSLKTYDNEIIEYGQSEGKKSLREVVSCYYGSFGVSINADDILVSTGASEAILFALFSCFDHDEEIIIPEPFYANYLGFAQVTGIHMIPVPGEIENGFALPPIESFKSRITKNTRAIFLCNPGNPTGNLYNKEELKELAKLIIEEDIFLIVDEVYREFCYDEIFTSVLSIEGLEQHVLVIDSISKVFSSCGSRIGYLVTRNEELRHTLLKFGQLRLCAPMIGQHMAESCYPRRQAYITGIRKEYNTRRLYLYDRLSKMKDVKCYMPKAAFYIMTELPVDDAEQYCKWLLTDFEVDGATIMLAPGSGFYIHKTAGKKQVRIAFVLDVQKLEKAMDILERSLLTYQTVMADRRMIEA
ncbi:MAG: pyridoxal phosphate-dependent aminotransferase [Saprospiraceae bacterium]